MLAENNENLKKNIPRFKKIISVMKYDSNSSLLTKIDHKTQVKKEICFHWIKFWKNTAKLGQT